MATVPLSTTDYIKSPWTIERVSCPLNMSSPITPVVGCFPWSHGSKPKKSRKPKKPKEKRKGSQVVPDYTFEASKQTIEILQKFGDILPVPCANQVLEIGLALLTTYEVRQGF